MSWKESIECFLDVRCELTRCPEFDRLDTALRGLKPCGRMSLSNLSLNALLKCLLGRGGTIWSED